MVKKNLHKIEIEVYNTKSHLTNQRNIKDLWKKFMNSEIRVQILIFGYLFPPLVGQMYLYISMVLARGHAHISMVSYISRTRDKPYPGPVNSRHLRYCTLQDK